MGLEDPHLGFALAAARAVEAVAGLEFPGLRAVVIAADALVEAARQPADCRFISNVGGSEPARSQSADVPARLDEDDAVMHAGDLNRRRDAGGRPAIDHDIKMFGPAHVPARAPAADRGKEGSACQCQNQRVSSHAGHDTAVSE